MKSGDSFGLFFFLIASSISMQVCTQYLSGVDIGDDDTGKCIRWIKGICDIIRKGESLVELS